ncbi:MAG: V-type ATP synthase subunit D [Eubacteriales bacterium]
MAEIRVNPTRMELKKLKTRLATARRGHKLMKDKRDELMRQFLDVVRETKLLREKVEDNLKNVNRGFAEASAVTSTKSMRASLMLPKKEGTLTVDTHNIMSVEVPVFTYDMSVGKSSDSYNFGLAFTSGELDSAVEMLGAGIADMIRLAQMEKTSQLLAEEIEKVRRRVNALEHVMIPQLERAIKSITMKLDENERSTTTRLMKIKDMMIEEELRKKRERESV